MITLILIREDTEKLCNHYIPSSKLNDLKRNSNAELFQKIQEIQNHLISLKQERK